MTESRTIRNHLSVAVKNIIFTSFMIFITFIWLISEEPRVATLLILLLIVISSVVFYIRWRKTTITFLPEEMVIERNTLFKLKKTIPYVKIASINADRDIIDRIFGTTKLKVNINSSINPGIPDALLTLDSELAESIRKELSEGTFDDVHDVIDTDSPVRFSNMDVILHGIFSLSVYQTIFALFLLLYSGVALLYTEGGIEAISLALFFLLVAEILPMLLLIIRYYDFKVFRTGETIHLKHGAIQNYRSSFEISRVNAVRIKRPFFARLFKRSYIEAEVVGIGGQDNSTRPMICILSKDDDVQRIMDNILPEFIYVPEETRKQPAAAKRPMIVNATLIFALIFPLMYLFYLFIEFEEFQRTSEYLLILIAMVIITVTAAAITLSVRLKGFDTGEDLFSFKNGILDRETITMNYEKVQIAELRSGILSKRLGLVRCRVSLLSASGAKTIRSGYFAERDTETIINKMLDKIKIRLSR